MIKVDLPELYKKRYAALNSVPLEILKPIPRRAVFKNATGVKVPIRKYIEEFDTGKKDVLLDLEQIAKKIWGEVKLNGEVERRKRAKLRRGDLVETSGKQITIEL